MSQHKPDCRCEWCFQDLRKALSDVVHYLDIALGDTDPNIPDDMTDEEIADEWPVLWACQLAAKTLQKGGRHND